jgi:hypothetical protein
MVSTSNPLVPETSEAEQVSSDYSGLIPLTIIGTLAFFLVKLFLSK